MKRWALAVIAGISMMILGAGAFVVGLLSIPGNEPTINPYGVGLALTLIGAGLIFVGFYRIIRRIEKLLRRQGDARGLAEIAYETTKLERGPRIVCLGGGTGLSGLLSGLKEHSASITAIVSVADDGGSSGRLRQDFDMLPPGDIRNCLIALADAGPVMAQLMQYRFPDGEMAGHAFGNLFLTVLARVTGNFGLAVLEANRILSVRGRVLPATLERVMLVASHPDGTKTTGQRHIAQCGKPISDLSLKPTPGSPPGDVLRSIAEADLIVAGPGSLYTSILPNLLDAQVVEAINQSKARFVFVVNTMTQPGETPNFGANDHLEALKRHAPGLKIDCVVVNSYRPSAARLEPLAAEGVRLVHFDREALVQQGVRIVPRDVIDLEDPRRHDPTKLAQAVLEAYGSCGATPAPQ